MLGTGPLVAGFALAALTLGWPVSASQAGKLYLRFGFRATALLGSLVVVGATSLLPLLDETSSVAQVGATCFGIGLGMGITAAPTLIAVQTAVGWQQRGVVTGTNMFFPSLGSALGVAVFGAVVNSTIGATSLDGAELDAGALAGAVHHVFLATAGTAVLLLVAVLFMPRGDRPTVPGSATA